jgi:AraC family transcriptional regulator
MTYFARNDRCIGRTDVLAYLETPTMRVEHRGYRPGILPPDRCTHNTITVVLSGRTPLRWMRNGAVQETVAAHPGLINILPVDFDDAELKILSPAECLHIFFAPNLTSHSALIDFDADPGTMEIARIPGAADPLLKEIGLSLFGLLSRPPETSDRLFLDGARAILAARLVSRYSNVAQRRASSLPSLPYDRLKRVLDLIDDRFADDIGLDELAAEACLSPFHFSRLFHKATGLSPHRYVTERRVREAKAKLAEGRLSLVEIALDSGFGSQGNFNRIFRKHTGLTPGQFRTERRS